MWSLWTLYCVFALALSIGRSDGPSGQGYSSVRVEALLAKMTLEDKVRLLSACSAPFRALTRKVLGVAWAMRTRAFAAVFFYWNLVAASRDSLTCVFYSSALNQTTSSCTCNINVIV